MQTPRVHRPRPRPPWVPTRPGSGPVYERDRFYSFQFRPATLVPGVQNYSPERHGKPRLL
jgi:hypothetical protein